MTMEAQQPAVVLDPAVGSRGVPQVLHSRSNRLADQAATAALLVTHPDRRRSVREPAAVVATEPQIFRESSASTDWRLDLSHASASAALAHMRTKPVQIWTPPPQPVAEKAAFRSLDLRAPEPIYVPKATPEGHKAATSALRDRRSTVNSSTLAPLEVETQQMAEYERKANERREKALMAATGAFNRRRAGTAPSSGVNVSNRQPSLAVSAAGASREAAVVDEPNVQPPSATFSPTTEASRIQHLSNTNRQLYTSHPPVGPDSPEEQRKRNVRQAAIISMARDMYGATGSKDQQQRPQGSTALTAAQHGSTRMQSRKSAYQSDPAAIKQVINLQEAAQKRAQEKLATIDDGGAAYREYYGTHAQPPTRGGFGSRRLRTSSETDAEQSMAIKSQMTSLRTRLNAVDKQREQDRMRLMEAARKNVDAAIHDMERQVYYDTGRAPTALQREWEQEAEERMMKDYQATAAAREQQQAGRVNIGAEKFVKMTDVEAIARSRVQPTLDEINVNAEDYHDQIDTQRAKELEHRLDVEQDKRFQTVERQREADLKVEEKRMKSQLKHENKGKTRRFRKSKFGKSDKAEKVETGAGEATGASTAEADTRATGAATGVTAGAATGIASARDTSAAPQTAAAPQEAAPREEAVQEAPRKASQTAPQVEEPPRAVSQTVPQAEPQEPALSSSSEEIPQMYPSQAVDGESSTVGGSQVKKTITQDTQSTRSGGSKLKTWILSRRRSSRQSSIIGQPHVPGEFPDERSSREPTRSASTNEGVRPREDSRGAALSSHPITGTDLSEMQRRRSVATPEGNTAAAAAAALTPAKEDTVETPTTPTKRSFVTGFKKMVTTNGRSASQPEIKTNGVSSLEGGGVAAAAIGDAGVNRRGSYVPDTHQASIPGREDLRNSAVEQGLPVPTAIGKHGSPGTRESRFSEDL